LHIKNLRTKRLSKELNYVKVRLFLISKRNELVTYILKLLSNIKIYLRFYINLLELANLEILIQRTFCYKIEEDNVFKVKKIIAYKGNNY